MRPERVRLVAIAVCGALLQIASAEGAQIRVLCSNGLRAVMLELVPEFERAAHHTVSIDQAEAPAPRHRRAGAEAVASGAVELGILPVSEILPVPGVSLAGVFPPAVQRSLLMVAAVAATARDAQAAGDLIRCLLDPARLPAFEAKGMRRP